MEPSQRVGFMARNFVKAALHSVELEARYTRVNPTLAQQRAGLLVEPHAAPVESPIGVMKASLRRSPTAEEIFIRARLNGTMHVDCVPADWVAQLPDAMLPAVRRLVRADMGATAARGARRVSNASRDRAAAAPAAGAGGGAAAAPVAAAVAADADAESDGSGLAETGEGYEPSPPPSPVGGAGAGAAGVSRRRPRSAAAAPASGHVRRRR
jgi:hypothetical protein